jgi:hypothetical protein
MKSNEEKCLCPACPTYIDCNKKLFCLNGKSKCITQEKGCLCGGCPVHMELKFKHGYYCTRDTEKKQEENGKK